MKHKLTQNLVSQSVSQSLTDSKLYVKSEISEKAVEIC